MRIFFFIIILIVHITSHITVYANEKTLIIPIFIRDKQYILWEPNNHWKSALSKYLSSEYKQNLIIPIGDLDDISLVNYDIINNPSLSNLQNILEKYNAQTILIASSHYFIDIKTNLPALELTLKYLSPSEEESKVILINDYRNNSLQFLLKQAVTEVINNINTTADNIEIDQNRKTTNIIFNLSIRNIENWIEIRKKLNRIKKIHSLIVKEISTQNAIISIDYIGETEELFTELKSYGFMLDKQHNIITISL
ncbi:hypothetical protein NOVO_01415 [Rickettsiales bacterium Ac37b]|nr:hypothetical protein NOVO_01415 [Rickettsiales bacterium Ac37b]